MVQQVFGVLCALVVTCSALPGLPNTHSGYVLPASPYFTKSIVAASPAATQLYVSPFARTYAIAPQPYISAQAAPVVKTVTTPVIAKSPVVVAAAPGSLKAVEYHDDPRYDFSYGVHDALTGDIKNQVESRNGGNVAGSYSVVDADGYKRTVTYTADDLNGFNAVVQREPFVASAIPAHHFQNVPVQQPVQGYVPQAPAFAVQPEPAFETVPIADPEQTQHQFGVDQQYSPYPQFEGSQQHGTSNGNHNLGDEDSDVVELRSAATNSHSASSRKSTPITENQENAIPPKRTA